MARPDQIPLPLPDDPGRLPAGAGATGARRRPLAVLGALAAVIAATAVLGAVAGLVWASVAPRALVEVVAPGSANVVNPETSAFIAADGWFTLLAVVGGIVSGLLGYALAVRRHGALAMAAILVGGTAAALVARWIGQDSGAVTFNHRLAVAQPGLLLHAPLTLGGLGPLTFWPLAAGLVAGGIEAVILLRARRETARLPGGGLAPPS